MLKTALSPVPGSIPAQIRSATFILGGCSKNQLSKALSNLVQSQSWHCFGWEVGPQFYQVSLPPKLSVMVWELCWAPEMAVEVIPLPARCGCRAGWVPWAQGVSLCLPVCTAALLSGFLIWRQGQKKRDEVSTKASCLRYSCSTMDRHSPRQGNLGWFFSTVLHLPSVPIYWSIKG